MCTPEELISFAGFPVKKDFLHGELAEGDLLWCQSRYSFPFSSKCIFFHFLINLPVRLLELPQF